MDKALDDARKFRDEGKFAEALERHVWYHNNALKYGRGHHGVRLSFALSDWVELGAVYPKALDAMRETRDETYARFKENTSDTLLFSEVMSLNFALNDLKAAKDLYYEGKELFISDSSIDLRLAEIARTNDLEWTRDVMGNPETHLTKMLAGRKEALGHLPDNDDSMERFYNSEIATFLKIVVKTHDLETAKKLQANTLKSIDSPEIRDALN